MSVNDFVKLVHRARHFLAYAGEENAVNRLAEDTGDRALAWLAVKGAIVLYRLDQK